MAAIQKLEIQFHYQGQAPQLMRFFSSEDNWKLVIPFGADLESHTHLDRFTKTLLIQDLEIAAAVQ
ncbi:MAG: hypothetical protein IT276_15310 [Ignavibacteriaceae bacterium]|nr:hypothetical protein [Ignavibacterium sp.]MCC6256284.1 hypothetical protein [Ignavibacteriaceae bacterium]